MHSNNWSPASVTITIKAGSFGVFSNIQDSWQSSQDWSKLTPKSDHAILGEKKPLGMHLEIAGLSQYVKC